MAAAPEEAAAAAPAVVALPVPEVLVEEGRLSVCIPLVVELEEEPAEGVGVGAEEPEPEPEPLALAESEGAPGKAPLEEDGVLPPPMEGGGVA